MGEEIEKSRIDGRKLRKHRENAALSIEQLAAETEKRAAVEGQRGISAKTIWRIEHGSGAQPYTIGRLADALGVEPKDLLESEEGTKDVSAVQNVRHLDNVLNVVTEPSRKTTLLDVDTQVHFADLITYHCSVFAGRGSELAQIGECIATKEGGYIFIEGPSGFGKTALLAYLTQSLPNAAYHFISQALAGSSDIFDPNREDCFLAGLCRQLQEKAQKSSQIRVNDLRGTYLSLLSEASDDGETTIVIIDAVDEVDPNRNFLRGLFPHRLPKNTFVIFSARTIGDKTYLPYLGLTSADIAATVTLDRFDVEGVRALLKKAGGKGMLLADKRKFVEVLHDTTEGDPFYLRFVVEDTRDGVIGAENIADTPRGLNDYLDMQFELLSKSATSQQQRDILALILHARGPLSRPALISLVHGLDPINFDIVRRGVRRFLLEHNGEFTFCHERFRQYFEDKV